MRVADVVLTHLGEGETAIVRPAAEQWLAGVGGRDRDRIQTGTGEARAGVLVVEAARTAADVTDAVSPLPVGASVAVVFPVPPEELPVGALLDAIVAAGAQLRDAVTVKQDGAACVLLVARTDTAVPPYGYLRPAAAPPVLDDVALRRTLSEQVLDRVVGRTREESLRSQLQATQDQVKDLRAQLQAQAERQSATVAGLEQQQRRLHARVHQLESSESLRVGQALVTMRRHPLRGARMFLRVVGGTVRRSGDTSS